MQIHNFYFGNNMKMFECALVFKAIVENGSMIKAAEAQGLNPSVVSKKLMYLENRLSLQLLKRTTRHIELTEMGEVFYERISNINQNWEASIDEVTSLNTHPKGTIRISSPLPLCSRLIVPLLHGFQKQYPNIRLQLIDTNYEELPHVGADITICRGLEDFNSSSFVGVHLFNYYNSLFASPNYLRSHPKIKDVSDLQQHQTILYGIGKPQNTWKFNDKQEVRINPYIASDSTEIVIASAVSGLGIAYIPGSIISDEISLNRLKNILPDCRSRTFETYLYYQKMNFTPQKIRLLIDYLKDNYSIEDS